MVMKMRECCCGCSLQTGTFMIALFQLVGSIMLTLSSSGQLNALPPTVDDQTITFGSNQISVEQLYQEVKGILLWKIGLGTLDSILNALFLFGLLKEKRIFVIIWLVANAIKCGLCVLVLIICFFKIPFNVIVQFGLGFGIGLQLYFILIVWSFHKSPEAGYNRTQSTAEGYDTENCNINRIPLQQPV